MSSGPEFLPGPNLLSRRLDGAIVGCVKLRGLIMPLCAQASELFAVLSGVVRAEQEHAASAKGR